MSNGSQIANDFYANIEIQSLTLNFIFSKKVIVTYEKLNTKYKW